MPCWVQFKHTPGKHRYANGLALDLSALPHITTFMFSWLEKHPEQSKCPLCPRQLSITKQGSVTRSGGHLLEEFQTVKCYQKCVRSKTVSRMTLSQTRTALKNKKHFFPLHHCFFATSLESKDCTVSSPNLRSRTSQNSGRLNRNKVQKNHQTLKVSMMVIP